MTYRNFCLLCKLITEYFSMLLNLSIYTIDLIPLCLAGGVELEDVDIAVTQSGIDEELTTEISSTGTQCLMFRCPSNSSIK